MSRGDGHFDAFDHADRVSEDSALDYRPGDHLRRREARRAAEREKRRYRRWDKQRLPRDR